MKNQQKKKKILIASDHAGFELKKKLVAYVKSVDLSLSHIDTESIEDMGAHTFVENDDYPAIMAPLAMRIATEPERYVGIVIGGSGNGEAMLCNRFPGVRAAVYYGGGYLQEENEKDNKSSLDIVRLAREHNDANVLSLGARFVSDEEAIAAVRIFLETPFSSEERHARRIAEIDAIE